MTEEIKRTIHFDERRKILSVKTEENKEAKIGDINGGTLKFVSDAEYNEEGIKMILANAKKDKEDAEKFIPVCKDRIKELEEELKKSEEFVMTPELEKLKKDMETLKAILETKGPQQKELENMNKMLENAQEKLKQSNKNIQEIQKEIGGRINFNSKNHTDGDAGSNPAEASAS